jgi:hypothetical protein
MLAKRGEFYPFAAAVTSAGAMEMVGRYALFATQGDRRVFA